MNEKIYYDECIESLGMEKGKIYKASEINQKLNEYVKPLLLDKESYLRANLHDRVE